MKKILMVAAALAVAFCLGGCKKKTGDNSLEELKERGKFILGLDASFPPMGFIDENSEDRECIGYDIDLGSEVAKRLGVDFVAQPIDWNSKDFELDSGNIDCIWNGLSLTDDRKASMACTKPYLNNEMVLVVRKDGNVKSLEDVAGKKVGVQNGSSAQNAIDGNVEFKNSIGEILKYDENVTALQDLAVGGVDAVVVDSVVAEWFISNKNDSLEIVGESFAKEAYGVAFRKDDLKLRDSVQQILEEMEADGTVERLCLKWFGKNISVIGK